MKRPEKEAVVAQLTEEFRNADAVYLTEYRGLTVPQISDLREKLGRDTSYTVAKNTLARIAAKEAGIEGLDEILSGPTAITFVKGDFIEAAKVIRDFAKDNKALVIKGAAADGTDVYKRQVPAWRDPDSGRHHAEHAQDGAADRRAVRSAVQALHAQLRDAAVLHW